MFMLKKIISAALLPPGAFVVILLIMSWRLALLRRFRATCSCLLLALSIWALSTPLVAGSLSGLLEQGLSIPDRPRGDVIVLLGGGILSRAPDLTGSGSPSPETMSRLVTAVRLQRRLEVPILVSGGVVYAGQSAEAIVVKRFLLDLGVAPGKILTEEKSRDTGENARFSAAILRERHFRQPLLVTTARHMRRSLEAFLREGVSLTPVPCGFTGTPGTTRLWGRLLPSAGSLYVSSSVLHEYLGLLSYRLAGKWS